MSLYVFKMFAGAISSNRVKKTVNSSLTIPTELMACYEATICFLKEFCFIATRFLPLLKSQEDLL